MRFDATLQTAAGYNFQLVLVGPANLQVDNVSLLEDGVQRVTRFSQDDAGRITAFLSGPLSGVQTLAMQGTIPVAESGVVTLPRISVEGAESKKSQVNIYRSPAMLVDMEQVHDLAPSTKEAGEPADWTQSKPTLPMPMRPNSKCPALS